MNDVKIPTKESYVNAVHETISKLEDIWILSQIYRFALNMAKGEAETGGAVNE